METDNKRNGKHSGIKQIKRYDFSKKPRKINRLMMKLARIFVVPLCLKGRQVTFKKTGMEGLKPPYLLYSTHSGMIDYYVLYKAIAPYGAHFVATLSGVRDVGDFLLSRLGCFYKRVFVRELNTVRNMRYCAEHYNDILCVFPESRYSFDGTCNRLPDSLGKTARLLKLPVVVCRMSGNYLTLPQWNDGRWKKVPIVCELEQIITAEETKRLSADEMQERIKNGLQRDDYAYQKRNRIELSHPNRAKGLHYILYQCPHCKTEYETDSDGARIWCAACGKSWVMTELGELRAENGETKFPHIPDWMEWQRENVRKEVRGGLYKFESEVAVHTLPHYKHFYDQGKGFLVQTAEETTLDCTAYGEKKHIVWKANELEGVHIEFNYPAHKKKRRNNDFGDCVEISTRDDSYWLHPLSCANRLMKISLAAEEIYAYAKERASAQRLRSENAEL